LICRTYLQNNAILIDWYQAADAAALVFAFESLVRTDSLPGQHTIQARWLLTADTIREHILREYVTEHACKDVDKFPLIVHVRGGDFLNSPAHRYSRIGQRYIDAAIDMLPGI
jgi:hypothetical protein